MQECIFCNIINGQIPSAVVYENAEFMVILDRFPAAQGHLLVLPKEHTANIFEIDPDKAGRLFTLAARVSRVMKDLFGLEHMNLLQNNGALAGQSVFHFHLHVIARSEADSISIQWKTQSLEDKEIEAMRKKIAQGLKSL